MLKKKAKRPLRSAKGKRYVCSVCGLAVRVDKVCGCLDTCDIICCGEQMRLKK